DYYCTLYMGSAIYVF
nr:immunoglobulin light chain junction region [Macaca mulatta]MOY05046.1 immunoglobulin light chain junction region [Macaca mulatta]MOY07971.1 immunoglobulin light chain junction region [Macaca mulatta]MOY08809.1 immunoglobulin light chain junction region [Macaca mulatta]MOY09015.1 immunoglobulin light chain junction region [Macaca mulatta]